MPKNRVRISRNRIGSESTPELQNRIRIPTESECESNLNPNVPNPNRILAKPNPKPSKKKQTKNVIDFSSQKTPKMDPTWDPKCTQNRAQELPKSSLGDCKVIPGRKGLSNGTVECSKTRFGHPRGPFWVRFRGRKSIQP